MAFATHLTLATGHNLLLGEGDEMQRVGVSITYELERGDLDVPLLATVKASEVAEAHRAAAEVLRAHTFCPHQPTPPPFPTFVGPTQPEPPPDGMEEAGSEDREAEAAGLQAPALQASALQASALQASALQASALQATPFRAEEPDEEGLIGDRTDDEAPPGDENEEGYVPSEVPSYRDWIAGAGMRPPGPPPNSSHSSNAEPAGAGPPPGPVITKPQKIAIESLARKIGLAPYQLSNLLYDQFQTSVLGRLTKEQAHDLHVALQHRLKEKQQQEKEKKDKEQPVVSPQPIVSQTAPAASFTPRFRRVSSSNGRTAAASQATPPG